MKHYQLQWNIIGIGYMAHHHYILEYKNQTAIIQRLISLHMTDVEEFVFQIVSCETPDNILYTKRAQAPYEPQ
jgi:hypothetical protein